MAEQFNSNKKCVKIMTPNNSAEQQQYINDGSSMMIQNDANYMKNISPRNSRHNAIYDMANEKDKNHGYTLDEIIEAIRINIQSPYVESIINHCRYVYPYLQGRVLGIASHPIVTSEIITLLQKLSIDRSETLLMEFIDACHESIIKTMKNDCLERTRAILNDLRQRTETENIIHIVEYVRRNVKGDMLEIGTVDNVYAMCNRLAFQIMSDVMREKEVEKLLENFEKK